MTAPDTDHDEAPQVPDRADRAPALVQRNAWQELRRHTPARIALGRVGSSMPTDEVLRFGWAHAQAQDAVHRPLAPDDWCDALARDGLEVLRVASRAGDRRRYLLRPDLGRRLDAASAAQLAERRSAAGAAPAPDLVIVVGDGLSSLATDRHAPALIHALRPRLPGAWRLGPVVVATQARVALGDEVGELLNARIVVVLIGERPGLSSPDSLGIYLTFAPRVGRTDAQRNCISNVRPEGLTIAAAAAKLAWLLDAAARLGASGVELKDDSSRTQTSLLDAPDTLRSA